MGTGWQWDTSLFGSAMESVVGLFTSVTPGITDACNKTVEGVHGVKGAVEKLWPSLTIVEQLHNKTIELWQQRRLERAARIHVVSVDDFLALTVIESAFRLQLNLNKKESASDRALGCNLTHPIPVEAVEYKYLRLLPISFRFTPYRPRRERMLARATSEEEVCEEHCDPSRSESTWTNDSCSSDHTERAKSGEDQMKPTTNGRKEEKETEEQEGEKEEEKGGAVVEKHLDTVKIDLFPAFQLYRDIETTPRSDSRKDDGPFEELEVDGHGRPREIDAKFEELPAGGTYLEGIIAVIDGRDSNDTTFTDRVHSTKDLVDKRLKAVKRNQKEGDPSPPVCIIVSYPSTLEACVEGGKGEAAIMQAGLIKPLLDGKRSERTKQVKRVMCGVKEGKEDSTEMKRRVFEWDRHFPLPFSEEDTLFSPTDEDFEPIFSAILSCFDLLPIFGVDGSAVSK
mmetsp:Transcript_28435/g.72440  ORF Transcript_28435/g.72440 Transcript_28435/m.72440 type:complete len:454 (-) Transcript_28435:245-1606(-)